MKPAYLIIILIIMGSCASMFRQRIDFRYVFKANNVKWLKKIEIDKACIEKIQKEAEDTLKIELSDYECYKSNSFERAIHFWSKTQPFERKEHRIHGKDFLVVINENCRIQKITGNE